MSKVHCLEYEPEDGSAPSPAAAAPAVDPAPPPQPSSRRRRSSILKKNTTDSSDDEAVTSSADRPTTHRRRVSFTSVDIAEHDLTLGDHPDCSYGPPTALDWKPIRRHSIDLEEFEGSRCKESGNNPRLWTKKRTVILTHQQRINALKKAGYSDKEIEKATNKKIWAKNLRSITRSYANTPVDKAEEVLSSVSRKFKKVVKITPSSKKNQPTFSVKDLKDDSSSSTKKVTVETPTMESVAPASA